MNHSQGRRTLLQNRRLSVLIAAAALSAFGDWLYLAALPIVVFQTTGDPVLLGIAAAGRLLPFFLLSVPAGAVADRFDRRLVLVASESTRAVLMFAMAATALIGGDPIALIVLATASAAAGTFAMPANRALLPEVARDGGELGLANAVTTTLENAASVLAPLVAAVVVGSGLGPACLLNGSTFAVVVVALVAIGPATSHRPSGAPAGDADPTPDHLGLRSLLRRAAGPFTLDAAISFASGAFGVLPVLVAVRSLHGSENLAGVLNAASGGGAVLGGVVTGLVIGRGSGASVRIGIAAAALAVIGLAVPQLAVVVAASVVAMAALVVLDTLNVTALQRGLPSSVHGRAFGLLHASAAAFLIAGSSIPPIVVGLLGLQVGVQAAVILTAGVVAVLGGASVVIDRLDGRSLTDMDAGRARRTAEIAKSAA